MEVMAADPSSPAPPAAMTAAPEPPYHHPPADHPSTPPPKPSAAAAGAGLRTPSPSPSVQVSGYSLHELLLLSPPQPSSRRHRSRARGAAGTGVDESLEIVAVAGTPTPPRRRRRGAAEQCAAPALASPRNTRRARRRLEKDVEAEEDAARRARRRISTAQVIFSGEPLMTLKVLPVLLFGAKYGSLVTVWRLLAAVEILRDRAQESWKSCPRKKLVAATAATMCWNMFSVKTRVMAVLFCSLCFTCNTALQSEVPQGGHQPRS